MKVLATKPDVRALSTSYVLLNNSEKHVARYAFIRPPCGMAVFDTSNTSRRGSDFSVVLFERSSGDEIPQNREISQHTMRHLLYL
jgi:hypothetical protein